MDYWKSINKQYGQPDLITKILTALRSAGKDTSALTVEDLGLFEEIHIRGRTATMELAQLVGLFEGIKVLDVGCGIGGPARALASKFGCYVTGIDLSKEYCRAAEILTERVGLSDKVTIYEGNALDMPFDDNSFDLVWIQHTLMNIKEKKRLFDQIYRVLKQNGRLAFNEVFAGSVTPLHFPVGWANDPSINFLVSPEEARRLITLSGFGEVVWTDVTEESIKWFQAITTARPPDAPPPIGIDLVIGPDFREKIANLLRNLEEGRIVVVYGVFERKE